ncbi:MAG: carboxypeptidase-like regulatory domain-containing protein, partial [Chitinophagaceae bacterium]|nr:carboxypeptidase-like regulatory domain-containing protein [Chitinophagaceae bacterium]
MKKLSRFAPTLAFLLFYQFALSQTHTLSGTVKNSANQEFVSAASVVIKGSTEGTFTDSRGNFKITVNQPLPITLVFSSIGFESRE